MANKLLRRHNEQISVTFTFNELEAWTRKYTLVNPDYVKLRNIVRHKLRKAYDTLRKRREETLLMSRRQAQSRTGRVK